MQNSSRIFNTRSFISRHSSSHLQQDRVFPPDIQCKWRTSDGLLGKRYNVTLQPRGVSFFTIALVYLMKVAAHAQKYAARTGWGQEVFMKFVTSLLKILHAIGLGEHASSIESVNI